MNNPFTSSFEAGEKNINWGSYRSGIEGKTLIGIVDRLLSKYPSISTISKFPLIQMSPTTVSLLGVPHIDPTFG